MSAAAELLGLLAEQDRLRVVAALALGASSLAEVTQAAGLDVRRAGRALARLEEGGLVAPAGSGWRLRPEVLREAARAGAAQEEPADFGSGDPDTDRVLRAFFKDGRLVSMPASHAKRLVVLDHLARLFDPGVRYEEKYVNTMLRAFHDDYAALRRYLVDAGFLSRENGEYWRSGGSYPID